MKLLVRLVSVAVAAYALYVGATTNDWKGAIATISLCALVVLISFVTQRVGSKPGSHGDSGAAIYPSSIDSSSSCSSDGGGGGDC